MDVRRWGPEDRSGGLLDALLDALWHQFPNLVVERLVGTYPSDDDNVYWLTIGPPAVFNGWPKVQLDTSP